jgi:hypothetical protein
MDGTGSLFSEFIAALPRGLEPVVVTYPLDRSMNYAELEQFARARLPTERPFVLVGESFSGPIRVGINFTGNRLITEQRPLGTGIGLRANEQTSTRPRKPAGFDAASEIAITAALLFGRYASRTLRERLSAAISKVDPAAWQARLSAVLSADVAVHVSSIRVPSSLPARGARSSGSAPSF